jgi:hypothetical protein
MKAADLLRPDVAGFTSAPHGTSRSTRPVLDVEDKGAVEGRSFRGDQRRMEMGDGPVLAQVALVVSAVMARSWKESGKVIGRGLNCATIRDRIRG